MHNLFLCRRKLILCFILVFFVTIVRLLYLRTRRYTNFFNGSFKEWNNINIINILKNKKLIQEKNLKTLQIYIEARNEKNIFLKILLFKKTGVFRQSLLENFIFSIGVILNKI